MQFEYKNNIKPKNKIIIKFSFSFWFRYRPTQPQIRTPSNYSTMWITNTIIIHEPEAYSEFAIQKKDHQHLPVSTNSMFIYCLANWMMDPLISMSFHSTVMNFRSKNFDKKRQSGHSFYVFEQKSYGIIWHMLFPPRWSNRIKWNKQIIIQLKMNFFLTRFST